MLFVDLFAGIGGFHQAIKYLEVEYGLETEVVFACEIDTKAKQVYSSNFKCPMGGDIRKIPEQSIPRFDFLCAGFPCQPFSKGGYREGFADVRGTLFFDIIRILQYHTPKYVLLENVPNLVTHKGGNTYKVITEMLRYLGYSLPERPLILSPHEFGVPCLRKRLYLPCIYDSKRIDCDFTALMEELTADIYTVALSSKQPDRYYIDEYTRAVLDMWDEFYQGIDLKIIGFPIWSEEFGQDSEYDHLPKWKIGFIEKNRALYARNRKFIDHWSVKYDYLSWCKPSHRKFEWQAGDKYHSLYQCLIQFRPSGVRVKRPDYFSTLVAMNHPQIIGRYCRYLTPDEVKQLQGFPTSFKLHNNDTVALKQLGNAVNAQVVKLIMARMLQFR